MVEHTPGLKKEKNAFKVAAGHAFNVYLGQSGSAITIEEVASLALHEDFITLQAKKERVWNVAYDAVYAVCSKPSDDEDRSRTGF